MKTIHKYAYRLDRSKLTKIDPNRYDSIALHHMAHPSHTINSITDWHIDGNKWAWIGYQYWIGLDGKIYECRGLHYQGAGVANHNGHILSIGFQGDYNRETTMPKEQFESGVWLIKFLLKQQPTIKIVDQHSRWNPTSCAGKYFPLSKMLEEVTKPEVIDSNIKVIEDKIHVPDEELIKALTTLVKYKEINSPDYWIDHAIIDGNVKGEYAAIILKRLAEIIEKLVDLQEKENVLTRMQIRKILR
jgi:hypothetical protein